MQRGFEGIPAGGAGLCTRAFYLFFFVFMTCMCTVGPVHTCVPATGRAQAAAVRLSLSGGDAELEPLEGGRDRRALPSTHLCSKAPSKSGRNVSAAGRGPASECQSFSGQHPEPACLADRTGWREGAGSR